uniref:Uncharacterized protein n=1 Tax=Solanum lycopersicum TaxID=4081 RepID=A0A3Q7I7B6_SOLLC
MYGISPSIRVDILVFLYPNYVVLLIYEHLWILYDAAAEGISIPGFPGHTTTDWAWKSSCSSPHKGAETIKTPKSYPLHCIHDGIVCVT